MVLHRGLTPAAVTRRHLLSRRPRTPSPSPERLCAPRPCRAAGASGLAGQSASGGLSAQALLARFPEAAAATPVVSVPELRLFQVAGAHIDELWEARSRPVTASGVCVPAPRAQQRAPLPVPRTHTSVREPQALRSPLPLLPPQTTADGPNAVRPPAIHHPGSTSLSQLLCATAASAQVCAAAIAAAGGRTPCPVLGRRLARRPRASAVRPGQSGGSPLQARARLRLR